MPDPIDYISQLAQAPDAGVALLQAFQQGQARQVAQAQQQRALQQQAALDAAKARAIANPSGANYRALSILDPANSEAHKRAFDSLDAEQKDTELKETGAVYGALQAGRYGDAKDRLTRRRDAEVKAGRDGSDYDALISAIDEDPDAATLEVGTSLAAAVGHDKFDSAFKTVGEAARADEQLPGQIALTGAQAAQANATAGKTAVEAAQVAPNAQVSRQLDQARIADLNSQIDNRAGQLELSRDTLQTNTQMELEKLYAKGTPMSGASEQTMTTATLNAESARQMATRADKLASDIEKANLSGGWFAALGQATGNIDGAPNLLRKEYQTLINQQAVKNLPPGPASDKDIQLAKQGFPAATANKETVASFLRGMAKLQTLAANSEQAKADWVSENGNIGRALKDITVNGARVAKGTTFGEFSTTAAATQRREEGANSAEAFNAKFGGGR